MKPARRAHLHLAYLNRCVRLNDDPYKLNFFGNLLRGILTEAEHRGISLSFLDASLDLKRFRAEKAYKAYDGIIGVVPWDNASDRTHWPEIEKKTPCVNMLFRSRGNYIGTDEEKALSLLVMHLKEQGYRRIGFFSLSRQPYVLERFHGFVRALSAHALTLHTDAVLGVDPRSGSFTDGAAGHARTHSTDPYAAGNIDTIFTRYLRSADPDAVIFESDKAAYSFMRYAGKHGIRIPADIAITGIDDDADAARGARSLTTIHQDFLSMGRAGAAVLSDICTQRGRREHEMLIEPELIIRRSTMKKDPPGDDFTARIQTYIKKHFSEPDIIKNMTYDLGMNRAYLLRKYRTSTGKNLPDAVNDVRLTEAADMLRNTERPVTDILFDAGFSSHQHFDRLFKRKFGQTAKQWRS